MPDPIESPSTANALCPGVCLLTVWGTGPGSFAAHAVLPDGTQHVINSAAELARLLRSLGWLPAPPRSPGLG